MQQQGQELRQSVQVSKQEQRAGRQGTGAVSHQQERVRAAHQAWTRESSFKIPTAFRKRGDFACVDSGGAFIVHSVRENKNHTTQKHINQDLLGSALTFAFSLT